MHLLLQNVYKNVSKKNGSTKSKAEKFDWKSGMPLNLPWESYIPQEKVKAPLFTPHSFPISFAEIFLTNDFLDLPGKFAQHSAFHYWIQDGYKEARVV